MLSINGTTNYSTARIDGVIFTDTSAEIEKIKEDITGITYNDVTDTTNIDNNVNITNDLIVGGDLSIPNGVFSADRINVGQYADAVAQNASISVGDNYGKIQVSSYDEFTRPTLLLENKFSTTQGVSIQGPTNSNESLNIAFTKAPVISLVNITRTQALFNSATTKMNTLDTNQIVQPLYNFIKPNEMCGITMYDDENLVQGGTGVIKQTGTQENYLKGTNTTLLKTDRALIGYETDEFINKDDELRLYFPLDTILGSAFRLHNYNKYFVNGTYTSVPMTNTGTLTNSNQVGQVGNTSFEYTNGRYFWNYTGSNYDCNYLSFGGWVRAFTSTTSSRLFFVNVNGTTADATIDVDVGGNMYFTCDGTYFINTTIQASGTNNVWFHIFVVIDGTTQKVYRNGTLINTTTRTLFTANSAATFGMGRTSLMGSSTLDDLRLYSRALTADEVGAIYRYRGSLTEPYPIKMNGTIMIGDRIDQNNATRVMNIRDTNGIISIARYVGGQAGFELLTYDSNTGARTSNVLCLGGGSGGDAFQVLLRQNGIDNFVFQVSASLCQVNAPMRVIGNLRIDGGITQETSTSTNLMRAITLYADQNLTQSGTGIITQSGTGTNALKNTSITGTLAITGYSDVKTTLDTFSTTSTAITGISYNSSTDTTTIDNNVKINKNLKLEDNTVVLTAPTGYVMDECEKHTWLYSINRPIGAAYRTIRTTSFDALNINADFNTPSGRYTFQLVKIFKGVTYTGAFMINSSVGTNGHPAQMALMEAGVGKVSVPLQRLAVTDTFTTSGSTLHYAPFRVAYTATETGYAYIGYVITAVALNPVVRGAAISYNNNYKITTCQTGSLTSLCCGYSGSTTASFDTMGTSLNPSQAMTAFSTQMYCGLYTDQ